MMEIIEQFRQITGDHSIDSDEIGKFIKWGKGNLEQALNYYYVRMEKSAKTKKVEIKVEVKVQSSNAFATMTRAMSKQKRTEEFIKQVREEYKLPIKGRTSMEGSKEAGEKKQDKQNEMDVEFAEADYLPEIFNITDISQEKNEIEGMRNQFEQNRREISARRALEQSYEENKQEIKQASNKKNVFSMFSEPKSQPKEQPKFQYAYDASQYLLGQVILDGFAVKFENNLQLPQRTPLQFRYHFQEQKKKKKGFKSNKNSDKSMNIRLVSPSGQFGRINDEQARIFLPLIVHGMLRFELFSHFIPKRTDYYTKLKVKAKVHLLKKAITDPVVETFQGHSDLVVSVYKPVAEELLSLFDRLQLPIVTWPLIKRKSKLKAREEAISLKRQQVKTQREDEQRKMKEMETRQRTDPMFKSIQKNITEMFKNTAKESTYTAEIESTTKQKSAVKKRVLQLKTIEQDKCSQLIDLYEEDLEPCNPSERFTSHLYDYQSRALAWMLKRQGHQQHESKNKQQLHPLWTQFQLPQGERLFLNELTSQVSAKPPMSKTRCYGGILADEMGLGKTVMMVALMVSAIQQKRTGKRDGKNLVVVPLTLLSQWQSQIKRHSRNTKTLIYYGQQRKANQNNLNAYDIIITTYGTISHQFSKGFHLAKNGIYKMHWERIILDEAHYIKGRVIQTAKAVYELQGMNRWCLTGTPIQNNLTDLFSLVHFIKYTPWAEYECWNKYINKPAEMQDENVYEVLRTILKRVFLRRTKQSKDHLGNPIVQLPPRHSKIQILQMGDKQRQFYDAIYQSSRSTIQQLQKQGILQARYMQVLEILMRLRQICCHPILYKAARKFVTDTTQFEGELRKFVKKRQSCEEGDKYYEPLVEGEEEVRVEVTEGKTVSEAYIKEVLGKIEKNELENCPVCLSEAQDPVITSCLHIFCRTCAIRQIEQCGICSACRKRLDRDDFIYLPRENRFNLSLTNSQKYFRSTKLQALIERLQKLQPDDKVVVFSQFLGMLDLIEHDLKQEKLSYVRMEGSTSHKQRTRIVESFQKDSKVKIFIVSLKTAGVGLNLVAANKVFLMDPWWNPGVQDQAIERVHRIGQLREVEIVRFIMDRSIEMRMMQLNTNKKQLSQKVLSQQTHGESKVQKLKYLMERY